jgi:hypothetical protein
MGTDRAAITKTGENGPTEKRCSGTGRRNAGDLLNRSAMAGRWGVGEYPQKSESSPRAAMADHGRFDQRKSASA